MCHAENLPLEGATDAVSESAVSRGASAAAQTEPTGLPPDVKREGVSGVR